MKFFFTILGICIVGIMAEATDEEKDKLFGADEKACIEESGIVSGVLEKFAKEQKMDKDDEKLACFVACMSKKFGLMNSDGSINESKLRVQSGVSKERAVMIKNKCKVMKGVNDCDTAWKVINCMYEEDSLL